MEPIRRPYSNITLTARGCRDLPATRCATPDGGTEMETAWALDADELADLAAGGPLYIYLRLPEGAGHPPIFVSTRCLVDGWAGAHEEQAEARRANQNRREPK